VSTPSAVSGNGSFPVYLFDVDGTLTDSAPDICGAVAAVLEARGYPPQPYDFLRTYIGRHLRDLWADILPPLSEEDLEGLTQHYRVLYAAREHAATKVFDGVAEMLAALGGRKSTATTKGTPTTRIVLEKFGLLPHFHHVQGTDGFPAKPAPDVIHRSLAALDARPEDALLVGDAPADMAAGRAAGVRICAVTWGYGDLDQMRAYQPDFWIEHPSQILGLK
jgi:phosphoglycolate phosphatase